MTPKPVPVRPALALVCGLFVTSIGLTSLVMEAGYGPLVVGRNFTPAQWAILVAYLLAGTWLTSYAATAHIRKDRE